jgi:hypothetical protein
MRSFVSGQSQCTFDHRRKFGRQPCGFCAQCPGCTALEVIFLEFLSRSARIASTARPTPRMRSIGPMPSATALGSFLDDGPWPAQLPLLACNALRVRNPRRPIAASYLASDADAVPPAFVSPATIGKQSARSQPYWRMDSPFGRGPRSPLRSTASAPSAALCGGASGDGAFASPPLTGADWVNWCVRRSFVPKSPSKGTEAAAAALPAAADNQAYRNFHIISSAKPVR